MSQRAASLFCASVLLIAADADGSVERGNVPAAGSARRSKLAGAVALSLLALAAVALVVSQTQGRVVLQSEEQTESDTDKVKLDKLGLNLDHWPWDRKPPVNHAAKSRMQSLVNRKNVLVKEWETPQHKLYRHGYDDKYNDQPQVVSIGDIIKNPTLYVDTSDGQ